MAMHDRRSPQPVSLRTNTGVLHRLGGFTSIGISLLALGLGGLLPVLLLAQTPPPSLSVPHRSLLDAGLEAFSRGAFEHASEILTQAAQAAHDAGHTVEESDARAALARAYLALGFHTRAAQNLDLAVALAREAQDLSRQTAAMELLGQAYLAGGLSDAALETLQHARAVAGDAGEPIHVASIVHSIGAVQSALKQDTEAFASYMEARRLAESAHADALMTTATINGAKVAVRMGRWKEAQTLYEDGLTQVTRLPNSHDKAYDLISIGLGFESLHAQLPETGGRLRMRAAAALEEAGTIAKSIGDARAASYAFGYRGHLYEQERRTDDALLLSRLAVGFAQQVHAPESLYRWEWQTGRILKSLNQLDQALPAYQRAADLVQALRPEMAGGVADRTSSFRESSGRLFFELADVLLHRADSTTSRDEAQPYLIKAREAVELFKTAELRDYFSDDCVDAFQTRQTKLEDVSRRAAILYPIILPDRTELLVSLPDGMHRLTVRVSQEELTKEIRAFRTALQKEMTREYLRRGHLLYDWLLRPLEPLFAPLNLDTLVVVPDGPLRTIPFAALHDGKHFVISKYAVATTPGLNLTDPKPLARDRIHILSAGLSEAVQGFPSLPNADKELEAIGAIYTSQRLLNREFRVPALEQAMKKAPVTIVHIASHGKFERDVKNSFLLTFDEKLTMDRLSQIVGSFKFRDQPLELLSLSACQTAAGDDRAALGLAGVAIKAGARSALATLWFVNDEASSALVTEFYRQLKNPALSKAQALRQAQLTLLDNPEYQHPIFWSPFLLLNNWL
ncbi:MAG: CHAT domain-containing protein [Nitrospira sp.]|nr:CHAT domain-containing protein [Nitrospira sp.]